MAKTSSTSAPTALSGRSSATTSPFPKGHRPNPPTEIRTPIGSSPIRPMAARTTGSATFSASTRKGTSGQCSPVASAIRSTLIGTPTANGLPGTATWSGMSASRGIDRRASAMSFRGPNMAGGGARSTGPPPIPIASRRPSRPASAHRPASSSAAAAPFPASGATPSTWPIGNTAGSSPPGSPPTARATRPPTSSSPRGAR